MTNKKFQCKWEISRSCETLKDLRRSCEILKDLVRRSCVISITLNYNQSVCDLASASIHTDIQYFFLKDWS